MEYRIREGMDVVGPQLEKLGTVGNVVVGERTREPRFFTIQKGLVLRKDVLVPREIVQRVEDERVHVPLNRDQLARLPEYEGEPPRPEDVERAYAVIGGRRAADGYALDRVPIPGDFGGNPLPLTSEEREMQEDPLERAPGHLGGGLRGSRSARGREDAAEAEDAGGADVYVVTTERYLVLEPEERERQGYRDGWTYGGGAGP